MESSLLQVLRRLKPHKIAKHDPSSPTSLLAVDQQSPTGHGLLLDTTVYVDILKGTIAPAAERLIQTRICQHSAVCVGELTNLFGRLDPKNPQTEGVLNSVIKTIALFPSHRTFAPTTHHWLTAGVLCGTMIRMRSGSGDRPDMYLNDALLYAQAEGLGLHILTRNNGDFDLLNKIAKKRIVIGY